MSLPLANSADLSSAADRGHRLVGWKDIAAYLGKTDRTVKRWGRDRGLPVHRVPGTAKTSVYAYAKEVDRWLESARPVEEGPEERSESTLHALPVADAPQISNQQAQVSEPSHPTTDGVLPRTNWKSRWVRKGLLTGIALLLAAVALDVVLRLWAIGPADVWHGLFAAGRGSGSGIVAPETEKRAADDFYLRGRYEWNQRTPESLHRALDLFTQAIVHDPSDARAYAGLADTYDLLREYSSEADADVFPRAIAAAKKAVAIDGSLAEAHRALAFAEMYGDWNFAFAEAEFRRAIELDARDAQARRWYANALGIAGRYSEAVVQMNKAQELDPSSDTTMADKGLMLYNAGHAQEGIDLLKEVERSSPDFRSPHAYLMQIAFDRRDYVSFLREGQRAAELAGDTALGEIMAAAKLGYERGGSRGLFQALYEKEKLYYSSGKVQHVGLLAKTCLLMGKRQEVFGLMEDAYGRHDIEVLTLLSDASLLSLKGDPRYQALVRKINYPVGLAGKNQP